MSEKRVSYAVADMPVTLTLTRSELAMIVAQLTTGAKEWQQFAEFSDREASAKVADFALDEARQRLNLAQRIAALLVEGS